MNTKEATAKLKNYINSHFPVIVIISHEENRVMEAIREFVTKSKVERQVGEWSVTRGLQGVKEIAPEDTLDPFNVLEQIYQYAEKYDTPTLFILKDFHYNLSQAVVLRYIREIGFKFEETPHTLVLISPPTTFQTPPDLDKSIVIIDWPLPDVDELREIFLTNKRKLAGDVPINLDSDTEDAIIQSMRGLTAFEAESVLLSAIIAARELSGKIIKHIIAEKRQIIRKSGVLEFYDSEVTMNDVGGLRYLKQYAEEDYETFSEKAREANVDPSSGILAVGIPGGGKSLMAKAIAGGRLPLLRMDIGALMTGVVGGSEGRTREALMVAEATAPNVLWIDEIEKGLGSATGELDGGTSGRVFATILTWMQERKAPVYIVATANSVQNVRPELLRRFDAIFFVDLPNFEDRLEVLKVHLRKRNQDTSDIDLEEVANTLWGFTGGEIEKVVKIAIRRAYFEKKKLTTKHLLDAKKMVIPVARTMDKEIDALRNWAKDRALPASDPLEEEPKVAVRGRSLVLEDD